MKQLIKFFICLSILTANSALADSGPRHNAKGGEHILELVPGQTFYENKSDFTFGIDYEFFPKEDHHYSIGVSMEAEFMQKTQYFFGPHIAWYFLGHNKIFYSTGIGWEKETSFCKNRLGYGYEVIFKNHFVMVPSITLERTPHGTHSVLSVGFGFEF